MNRIMALCKRIPNQPENYNIRKQISSSVTSIGANFQEAEGAISKKDFINKIVIARKEAYESSYWLRVIKDNNIVHESVDILIADVFEIRKILSSIIFNIRGR